MRCLQDCGKDADCLPRILPNYLLLLLLLLPSTTTKQTREFKMQGLCANYSVVSEISDCSRPKLSQLSDTALVPM